MGYNELGGSGTVMGTEESRNNRLPKRAELDGGFDPKAALAKASAAPPPWCSLTSISTPSLPLPQQHSNSVIPSKVLFRNGFSCWEKNGLNSSINSADSDLWRLWQYASIPFWAASGCQRSGWSRLGIREAESREWLGLCKVKVHALFNRREGPWHQLIVAAQVSTMDNAR